MSKQDATIWVCHDLHTKTARDAASCELVLRHPMIVQLSGGHQVGKYDDDNEHWREIREEDQALMRAASGLWIKLRDNNFLFEPLINISQICGLSGLPLHLFATMSSLSSNITILDFLGFEIMTKAENAAVTQQLKQLAQLRILKCVILPGDAFYHAILDRSRFPMLESLDVELIESQHLVGDVRFWSSQLVQPLLDRGLALTGNLSLILDPLVGRDRMKEISYDAKLVRLSGLEVTVYDSPEIFTNGQFIIDICKLPTLRELSIYDLVSLHDAWLTELCANSTCLESLEIHYVDEEPKDPDLNAESFGRKSWISYGGLPSLRILEIRAMTNLIYPSTVMANLEELRMWADELNVPVIMREICSGCWFPRLRMCRLKSIQATISPKNLEMMLKEVNTHPALERVEYYINKEWRLVLPPRLCGHRAAVGNMSLICAAMRASGSLDLSISPLVRGILSAAEIPSDYVRWTTSQADVNAYWLTNAGYTTLAGADPLEKFKEPMRSFPLARFVTWLSLKPRLIFSLATRKRKCP
jgi:hypothetical protein